MIAGRALRGSLDAESRAARGLFIVGCAAALVISAGCLAPKPAPEAPRVAAPIAAPIDLFPDDLDFVLRIDAARLRQNANLAPLVRDLALTNDAELLASIRSSFEHATAIWVGTRWMSDGFHGDGMLAIERAGANEADASESEDRARSPASKRKKLVTGHSGVDAYERSSRARGEPVLEIVLRDRGVVLATAAEADAVLRVLRSGADDNRLDPPARGLVSFAGRVRPGDASQAAMKISLLREWTEGLTGYTGTIDETGGADGLGALDVEIALSYATSDAARTAVTRAKALIARFVAAGGVAGSVADSIRLTELGSSVRLRVEVPFAWLAKLH
jgi:hypothetical protein